MVTSVEDRERCRAANSGSGVTVKRMVAVERKGRHGSKQIPAKQENVC